MTELVVEKDMVASVHYTGTFPEDGEEFDSSKGSEPLSFLVGHKQMIPGFEREMMGATVGEKRTFTLPPEDAYGQPSDENVVELAKEQFGEITPTEGMMLMSDAGPFRVVGVNEETVKVDFNHPMAGRTLKFEVEVMDLRKQVAKSYSMVMLMAQVAINIKQGSLACVNWPYYGGKN